jgi:hypothetical protein
MTYQILFESEHLVCHGEVLIQTIFGMSWRGSDSNNIWYVMERFRFKQYLVCHGEVLIQTIFGMSWRGLFESEPLHDIPNIV